MIRLTLEADKPADLLDLLQALAPSPLSDISAEGSYAQVVADDDDDDDDDTPDEFRRKSIGFDISAGKSHH